MRGKEDAHITRRTHARLHTRARTRDRGLPGDARRRPDRLRRVGRGPRDRGRPRRDGLPGRPRAPYPAEALIVTATVPAPAPERRTDPDRAEQRGVLDISRRAVEHLVEGAIDSQAPRVTQRSVDVRSL